MIPLKARGPYFDQCLAHLQRQTYRAFDVCVVPDAPLALDAANVRVIASGSVLPNRKRQLAALASDAELLALLDDDAYPDADWLANAVAHFADPRVVAVGGPGITPLEDTYLQRASGAVYASALVSGSARQRYVPGVERDADVLPSCNLIVRRRDFLRHIEACTRYWPGEDTLLCLLLRGDGGRIVYDPKVVVHHHRRPLFAPHLRQIWSYALFRGFFLRRYRQGWRTVAYLAPAAFVLAHLLLLIFLGRRRVALPLAAATAYGACVAAAAIEAASAQLVDAPLVAAGIYATHLTYGLGVIAGLLRRDVAREG